MITLWLAIAVVNYQKMTIIHRLFLLRTVAIIIQLLTVQIAYFVMSLKIALLPLMVITSILLLARSSVKALVAPTEKMTARVWDILGISIFTDVLLKKRS